MTLVAILGALAILLLLARFTRPALQRRSLALPLQLLAWAAAIAATLQFAALTVR